MCYQGISIGNMYSDIKAARHDITMITLHNSQDYLGLSEFSREKFL
jgi:hypothetical protein